jgi:hypothetical protein
MSGVAPFKVYRPSSDKSQYDQIFLTRQEAKHFLPDRIILSAPDINLSQGRKNLNFRWISKKFHIGGVRFFYYFGVHTVRRNDTKNCNNEQNEGFLRRHQSFTVEKSLWTVKNSSKPGKNLIKLKKNLPACWGFLLKLSAATNRGGVRYKAM